MSKVSKQLVAAAEAFYYTTLTNELGLCPVEGPKLLKALNEDRAANVLGFWSPDDLAKLPGTPPSGAA